MQITNFPPLRPRPAPFTFACGDSRQRRYLNLAPSPQAGALPVEAVELIDVTSRADGFNDDAPLLCRHLIDRSVFSVAEVEAPQVVCFRQLPGIRWARIFFQGFQQIKGFQEILGRRRSDPRIACISEGSQHRT